MKNASSGSSLTGRPLAINPFRELVMMTGPPEDFVPTHLQVATVMAIGML